MNLKGIAAAGLAIWFVLVAFACAGASSTRAPATPAPETGAVSPVPEAWQQQWDKLVADAKKEGQVVIASSLSAPGRDALNKAFTGKYGINLEFLSGKPAELIPKVQSERRAGIYSVDLFIAGQGTLVPVLGPEGALESMAKVLVLPEVLDGKNWFGGDLSWGDPNHYQVMFLAYPSQLLTINTDLVRSDEIKSFRDLLNPKWRAKIGFLDPTMAGAGNDFFRFVADTFGLDYVRELEKQQPVFTRDGRMLVEWVARGKYPLVIGVKPEERTGFVKDGAPIRANPVAEGTVLSPSGGGVVAVNRVPHPAARALFINWLLSREGQVICSRIYGAQSAREDVPTNHLDPEMVRQPGVKYYPLIGVNEPEEKIKYMDLARKTWGHLLK